MDEKVLMQKLSILLDVPINRIQWDLSYLEIIELLVSQIDKFSDEIGVNLYEK
jgi:hypothetical protein